MIFAIIIGGLLFARFLALSGMSGAIRSVLVDGGFAVWAVVAMVTLIYLVLSMLTDAPSLLAISLPITHPVMMWLGFDPFWFGVHIIVPEEIRAITPPVGRNCFVANGAAGNLVTLEETFRALTPFILAAFLMSAIMLMSPQVALFLPGLM